MIDLSEVHFTNIKPAPWRANYLLAIDRTLLAQSLISYGWLSPIIVNRNTMEIIDGFSRWVLSQTQKELLLRDRGKIPVSFLDIDDVDAKIMHVRINRGVGGLMPFKVSDIIKSVRASGKYSDESLALQMAMTELEFFTLADGRAVKTKQLKEHKYSSAWVPIEAPPAGATIAGDIVIEKPPNADR